jgi:hypothetical protein
MIDISVLIGALRTMASNKQVLIVSVALAQRNARARKRFTINAENG